MNLDSMKGMVKLVKSIFLMTISFETVGALLSFISFSKNY